SPTAPIMTRPAATGSSSSPRTGAVPCAATSASAGATPTSSKCSRAWRRASASSPRPIPASPSATGWRSDRNEKEPQMLSMRELSRVYRTDMVETTALDGIMLDVEEGEFVAVMGPSGCGKSTLLNVMGMLDSPSSGSYVFDGTEIAGLSEARLADFRKRN